MERIRSIFYKKHFINCFDYRGLDKEADFLACLRETTVFLQKQNRQTLQLTNLTGVFITPGVFKPTLAEIEKCKSFVLKDAVVGIVGAKRVMFQTYLTIFPGKTKAFTEEAPALEWLVED